MATTPQAIRALKSNGVLEIVWPGGQLCRVPFKSLREECPCAECISEFTGERLLDPTSIPADILPTGMAFVGNYALKISWSDGHSTGLYTWENLERLSAPWATSA
jgi:DUF971 family protein